MFNWVWNWVGKKSSLYKEALLVNHQYKKLLKEEREIADFEIENLKMLVGVILYKFGGELIIENKFTEAYNKETKLNVECTQSEDGQSLILSLTENINGEPNEN